MNKKARILINTSCFLFKLFFSFPVFHTSTARLKYQPGLKFLHVFSPYVSKFIWLIGLSQIGPRNYLILKRKGNPPALLCDPIKMLVSLKVAPYNFSKKLNGTLVYNIFRQIYHLDESKQLIMINQRLDFTKRKMTLV